MKKGWTYKKLGEICRIGIGRTPSRSDMSLWDKNKETHNYWVSIADMGATENGYIADTKEYISDKAAENIQIIPKGTLLLSFKLTLGKTAIAGTDLYTNEAIANLPFIGNEVNREFLSYYFQFFNWEKFSAGDEKVLGKTLNKKKLDVLPVYYPSIKEQKRIVERLDAAFAQIDELKANAEKQLAEARVLFQKALAKAMEPKEGWEEKSLSEVCDVNRGRSKHRPRNDKRLFGGPYPFIQTGDIRNAQGGEIKEYSQTYSEFGLSQSKLWKKGTICITIAANIGETAILGFDACFPDSIVGIHPDETVLDTLFLNFFLLSIKKDIDSQSYGTAQKNINLEVLNNIIMRIPPLSEQQRIVERLDSISEKVRKYEEIQRKIIAECDALKQALLRQVFE